MLTAKNLLVLVLNVLFYTNIPSDVCKKKLLRQLVILLCRFMNGNFLCKYYCRTLFRYKTERVLMFMLCPCTVYSMHHKTIC